ncbi:jg11253 [Pararge aegeria aegeria]|uniref:Jg11253 protein n=1 Tax=Pararge aegeria aegeria TaxID=348720 RepID=A0A8S4RKR5_9NEOP|nr:jg11253 [Pararge aegeria aegeria]
MLAHSDRMTLEIGTLVFAGEDAVQRLIHNAGLLVVEWGTASKSLNPRARRSEEIVGLRAPHVGPNLGSGNDWSERVTVGD